MLIVKEDRKDTTMTVEKDKPLSHKEKGWEQFTDFIIKSLLSG